MRLRLLSLALFAGLAGVAAPASVHAAEQCRVIDVDLQPTDQLQMVAWLEDAQGNYVETMFITDAVGRRGLGNRPGRSDFNSGPMWPYGRRISTFPIWSRRQGLTFPLVVFQNRREDDLSHPFNQSSTEAFFCRPLRVGETGWDTATCPSMVYTDKGKLDAAQTSYYPPREDVARVDGLDDEGVSTYGALNPYDSVSQATPVADLPFTVSWPIPAGLPTGNYVLWMEVAKEFDHNSTYSVAARPSPVGIAFGDFGLPYQGQPSVVYAVPFEIGTSMTIAETSTYAGYGDPDGFDGNVRPPDSTITATVPGSGAARILLRADGSDTYRLRVTARPEDDAQAPEAPTELTVPITSQSTATVTFVAPSDNSGKVTGYDVRYRAIDPITEANFESSALVTTPLTPDDPGQIQDFQITGLLPETTYYVAVRAFDSCRNLGAITTARFTTPARGTGEVDACFVATAAYGSLLANQVQPLRQFRDGFLRRSVLGELFVETYYTVGPAFATVVEHSDPLREAARDGLGPIIDLVRGLTYGP